MIKIPELKTSSESSKVLASFLERYFFDEFRQPGGSKNIEFFIKASCPSKCAYCYLQQHQEELYPQRFENDDVILANVKSMLDFYKANSFRCDIEIFSGRIFHTDFGLKILDLIYDAFKDSYFVKPHAIIIPDDMQFILNKEQTAKIEDYIYKFTDIDIELAFSCSVDGKILDHLRFGKRVDEFYEDVKNFALKHKFNFHPMVSAIGIDKWVRNYDWWAEYNPKIFEKMMFLEVRNDNWTDERIFSYLELLNHAIDHCYGLYGREGFFKKYIWGDKPRNRKLIELQGSSPEDPNPDGLSCGLQKCLHIRMGDLAIVPCHRLGYPQFVAGKFSVENGVIDGISEVNPSFYMTTHAIKHPNMPRCYKCPLLEVCLGPCLGANYEATGDAFYTGNSVCKLMKAGMSFLMLKYYSLGFLTKLKKEQPSNFNNYVKLITYTFSEKQNGNNIFINKSMELVSSSREIYGDIFVSDVDGMLGEEPSNEK